MQGAWLLVVLGFGLALFSDAGDTGMFLAGVILANIGAIAVCTHRS
jgi:hypothetical protein